MQCLTESEIAELLIGESQFESDPAVLEHIEACEKCQARLAAAAGSLGQSGNEPPLVPLSDDAKQSLYAMGVVGPVGSAGPGVARVAESKETSGWQRPLVALVGVLALVLAIWLGRQAMVFGVPDSTQSELKAVSACILMNGDDTPLEFSSLAAAMRAATAQATIEVRSVGPHNLSLPEREGFRWRLEAKCLEPPLLQFDSTCILADGQALSLSGFVIDDSSEGNATFDLRGGELVVELCRVVGDKTALRMRPGSDATIDRTVVGSLSESVISVEFDRRSQLAIRQSILVGRTAIRIRDMNGVGGEMSLVDSTLFAESAFKLEPRGRPIQSPVPIHVTARGNLIQARFLHASEFDMQGNILLRETRAVKVVSDLLMWRGMRNLFGLSDGFTGFNLPDGGTVAGRRGAKSLDDWRGLCAAESQQSAEAASRAIVISKSVRELSRNDVVRENFELVDDDSIGHFGPTVPAGVR
ncbi:MAG: hypothetical protein AB8G99_23595 [Planctomycetaceae bacterium]